MQRIKEVTTAAVGGGSPIAGTIISFMEGVEPLLRVVSLLIGIIVGMIVMAISLILL